MDWRFWSKTAPRLLPLAVKKAAVSQFHIDEAAADKLRCVGKSGEFAGRRVRHIRLYDPESVSNNAGNSVGYAELDTRADRKALKFEGHIEKDGTVYLSDRRTVPIAPKVRPVSPRNR